MLKIGDQLKTLEYTVPKQQHVYFAALTFFIYIYKISETETMSENFFDLFSASQFNMTTIIPDKMHFKSFFSKYVKF